VADLGALTPVAVLAALYAAALTRHTRPRGGDTPIGLGRVLAGAGGIAALALALGPPIDPRATTDLTAHMTQHVLLLTIAPPLLILGLVPSMIAGAFSGSTAPKVRRTADRFTAAIERVPIFVLTALAVGLQSAALGFWHVPSIYDAAVTHVPLHALEHLSFLLTGVAFWWIVAGAGRRAGTAAAVVTIFVASLPGTLLGALMTLSTSPWYPHYAHHSFAAALQDQQLAGVVMWAVGGMAYVAAGAVFFVAWLRDLERTSPSRPTEAHPQEPTLEAAS
jgi:putative membrane protein